MKAFVFARSNESKGKFEITTLENVPLAFKEFAAQNIIAEFDYIECSGKSWTVVNVDKNSISFKGELVEGRIDHKQVEKQQQQQQQQQQREAEIASSTSAIHLLEAGNLEQLEFSQLEFAINNFYLFPTLEKGDEEIYSLREKLYMLSFCNTKIQAGIQTRLLSQIASVTSAAQTGNSGGGQPKWAPAAAMATMSKLGNIETDVDDMADGFLGED
ncbi:hypothetical protein OAE65_01045 [bacterium]|nr:hypothetical protein [bacterium]